MHSLQDYGQKMLLRDYSGQIDIKIGQLMIGNVSFSQMNQVYGLVLILCNVLAYVSIQYRKEWKMPEEFYGNCRKNSRKRRKMLEGF